MHYEYRYLKVVTRKNVSGWKIKSVQTLQISMNKLVLVQRTALRVWVNRKVKKLRNMCERIQQWAHVSIITGWLIANCSLFRLSMCSRLALLHQIGWGSLGKTKARLAYLVQDSDTMQMTVHCSQIKYWKQLWLMSAM